MSSEEKKSPDELSGWDASIKARKAWRRQSEEEKSPDEVRERWADLIKWWKMSHEEEGEKLRGYLERVERTPVEIPAGLREEIRSVVERDKQARAEMMERIAEGRFTPPDIGAVVEGQHELIDFLTKLGEKVIRHLEEADKTRTVGERRKVIVAAVGWALAIIMPLVVWCLSR